MSEVCKLKRYFLCLPGSASRTGNYFMFIIAWYVRAAGLVGFDIWKNSWSGNGNQLSTRRLENKQCFSFNSICCALVWSAYPSWYVFEYVFQRTATCLTLAPRHLCFLVLFWSMLGVIFCKTPKKTKVSCFVSKLWTLIYLIVLNSHWNSKW